MIRTFQANDHLLKTEDEECIRGAFNALRPGQDFTLCPLEKDARGLSLGGISNTHIEIAFSDGSLWLARVRRDKWYAPPGPAMWINVDSEAATLEALVAGGVCVPQARPAAGECRGARPFLVQEKLPGAPDHSLSYLCTGDEPGDDQNDAPARRLINESLAAWYLELEKVQFDKVGSLHKTANGSIAVGPEVTRQPPLESPPYFIGPFNNSQERYLAMIDATIDLIARGMCYPPDRAVQAFLVYSQARTLVAKCDEMKNGPFMVKHGEQKGDELLWSDGYKLTGVIDWEWARISARSEVFQPPAFWHSPRYFWAGDNDLSFWEEEYAAVYDDLGRPDLSHHVRHDSRKYQRLSDLLEHDCQDIVSINAMSRAFAGQPDSMGSQQPETMEDWLRLAIQEYQGDTTLDRLQREEALWAAGKPWRDEALSSLGEPESTAQGRML